MVTFRETAGNPAVTKTPNRQEICLENLLNRHVVTAIVAGEHSRLPYINDVITKVRHLVDTGAGVSVLPTISNDGLHEALFKLQAVNGKPTVTYCERYVNPNVGLRKHIHWIIIVADVSMHIICMDQPQHYNLFIDTRKRRNVDGNIKLSFSVNTFSSCRSSAVTMWYTIDPYY